MIVRIVGDADYLVSDADGERVRHLPAGEVAAEVRRVGTPVLSGPEPDLVVDDADEGWVEAPGDAAWHRTGGGSPQGKGVTSGNGSTEDRGLDDVEPVD